jgi:hypothetical protein
MKAANTALLTLVAQHPDRAEGIIKSIDEDRAKEIAKVLSGGVTTDDSIRQAAHQLKARIDAATRLRLSTRRRR